MKKTISVIASLVIASSMMFTSCKPKQSDVVNPSQVVVKSDSISFTRSLPSSVNSGSIDLSEYTSSTYFTVSIDSPVSGASVNGTTLTYSNTSTGSIVYFTITSEKSGKTTKSSVVFEKTTSTTLNVAPIAKVVANKGNITTLNASDFATDADGDKLTFVSPPTSLDGSFTLNSDNTVATFTPSSKLYYGTTNVSMSISDGKSSVNTNYIGNIGEQAQIATYIIFKDFLNTTPNDSSIPNYLVFSNTNVQSKGVQDSGFYGTSSDNSTYSINTLGELLIGLNKFTLTLEGNILYLNKNGVQDGKYQIVK